MGKIQVLMELVVKNDETRSKSEFWLKKAMLQLWWLLMILGSEPFNFEGSYFLHYWEKVFMAGLI